MKGVKGDVQRLTEQFDGFEEQISAQMKSLGDMMGGKLEDLVAEGLTGKAEPGEGGPSATPEHPSKTLSPQQDCLHEEGGDFAVAASQRPNPLGLPSQLPLAIRLHHKAGQKPLQRGRPRRRRGPSSPIDASHLKGVLVLREIYLSEESFALSEEIFYFF